MTAEESAERVRNDIVKKLMSITEEVRGIFKLSAVLTGFVGIGEPLNTLGEQCRVVGLARWYKEHFFEEGKGTPAEREAVNSVLDALIEDIAAFSRAEEYQPTVLELDELAGDEGDDEWSGADEDV